MFLICIKAVCALSLSSSFSVYISYSPRYAETRKPAEGLMFPQRGWWRWKPSGIYRRVLLVDNASDRLCFGNNFCPLIQYICRSGWPRGLRHGLAAVPLPILRFRIPPEAWMSVVSVVCCQVKVTATGWSLAQRSPNECFCVCVCPGVWPVATVTLYTHSE